MKRTLLSVLTVLVGQSLFAQHTPVSQTPQNKNVVLEELTGIHCGYCPDGHKRANDLATANPGRVVLVNIHAGGYAQPGSGEPDLRTTDGTALDGFFNPTGYPAGTVQRTAFGSETRLATGRGNWSSQVSARLAEASPANVAMDATIDVATRQVTLHVEIFYTTPQTAGTNHYLNVGILQNDFEAIQSNYGNYNPDAILPNGKYLHQHMFRGYINQGGTWGEQIDASQTTVITKTITYTLPANINNVDLNIGKLQFFAILHEGHNALTTSKVITAAEVTPDLTNVPGPTANASGIVNSFSVCDGQSITPIVKVTNSGSPITSIGFSTTVNGGTAVPFTFTGNIPSYGSQEITLPSMVVNGQATNSVTVTITSVNGGSGSIGSVATATKTIDVATPTNGLNAVVKMTTDAYGSEITWKLFNSANTVVASGGPYTDGTASGPIVQTDVNVTLSPNECYKAVVYDSYGDGFDAGYGNGDFKITVGGTTYASIPTFSAASAEDAMKSGATSAIDELAGQIGLSVYPNPASTVVNVEFEASGVDYEVQMIDLAGRQLNVVNLGGVSGAQSVAFPVDGIAPGNYLIVVKAGTASTTQKVVVQ